MADLTPVQSDLVALLREIGGILVQECVDGEVRLLMAGTWPAKVLVTVGRYADVEWVIVGACRDNRRSA